MGSVWGGSGGDGTSDAAPGGEPDAGDEDYLVELVVELAGRRRAAGRGAELGHERRETIGGDRTDGGAARCAGAVSGRCPARSGSPECSRWRSPSR